MTVLRRLSADDRGQVTVELLGITPLILVVLVALWQFVLVGYTYTLAGNAADEGARTAAVGGERPVQIRLCLRDASERRARGAAPVIPECLLAEHARTTIRREVGDRIVQHALGFCVALCPDQR